MAKSKAEWKEHLKGLVPRWVFEREKFNDAIFSGMAEILSEAETMADNHFGETFIDTAEGDFLNLHGSERNVDRIPGESDSAYRTRVKQIKNGANCPDLKALIDAYLINGEAQLIEDHNQTNFLNREGFLSRNIIEFPITYNSFTVIVDDQTPSRDTFLSREEFVNREDFIGAGESLLSLFEAIVNAINKNKAYGVVYRLLERVGA